MLSKRPYDLQGRKVKGESFDSTCSNKSRVASLKVMPRGLRLASVIKAIHDLQGRKVKGESFDSTCSNKSRVASLKVMPRGLRPTSVVKAPLRLAGQKGDINCKRRHLHKGRRQVHRKINITQPQDRQHGQCCLFFVPHATVSKKRAILALNKNNKPK